ncbi:MAG: hypothetical protein HHAS10_08250 [Candidatus Altimarinota bacterium]
MKRILLTLLFSLTLIGVITITDIYQSLETTPNLRGNLLIFDRNEKQIALLPGEDGYSIEYSGSLDVVLVHNIVSIEDKRFYSHYGIDLFSKLNVLRESLLAGKITRGGSTITEQYIKNRYFPEAPRSISQKFREGLWAFIAEIKYSKDEILKKYLETVYMGNGIYGIPAAIENYFGNKDINSISDEAISEIITRLRYPNLGGSSEEYRKQIENRLGLKSTEKPLLKREKKNYMDTLPFLTERIKKELSLYCNNPVSSKLSDFTLSISNDICSNPYKKIITSVDKDASIEANNILRSVLYPLEAKNVHNGAIYAWSEKEKKVILYIGNKDDAIGNQYDMIVKKRSVGSVLKPFLYHIILEHHDPNEFILDEAKVYETGQDGVSYVPENYIPKAYGPISLKSALGNSLNSATVRLTEEIGVSKVYENFRSLGFELNHDASYYGYGIVLGSIELSLENIVSGYRHITELNNPQNFLLYDILSDHANRSMTFGESSILNTSLPMAVKTGTSTDFHDNWTIAYTDEIIIGVWVGNADNSSMDDVSGVTGAGPIFHHIAEELIRRGYIRKKEIIPPVGVTLGSLCLDESCFRKEIAYTKTGYVGKSRPASKIYYANEFVTPLTSDEITNWKIR